MKIHKQKFFSIAEVVDKLNKKKNSISYSHADILNYAIQNSRSTWRPLFIYLHIKEPIIVKAFLAQDDTEAPSNAQPANYITMQGFIPIATNYLKHMIEGREVIINDFLLQPFRLHENRNLWEKFLPEGELVIFDYEHYVIPKTHQVIINSVEDYNQLYVFREDVDTLLKHSIEPIGNTKRLPPLITNENIEKEASPSSVSYTQINNTTTINQQDQSNHNLTQTAINQQDQSNHNLTQTTINQQDQSNHNLTQTTNNLQDLSNHNLTQTINSQQDLSSNTVNNKSITNEVNKQNYVYQNYHAPNSSAPVQSEEQVPSSSVVKKHDTDNESKPLRWDNSQEAASYYLAHEIWKIYPNIMIGDITGYAGFKRIREAHFDSERKMESYASSTTHGHISPAATDLLRRAGTRNKNEEGEESKKQFIELERNEVLKNLYISLIASMKSYRPSDKKTDYPNTKKAKEANSQPLEKEEFIDLRAIFSYIKSERHSRENDMNFFTPCPTYSKKDNKI